MEDVVHHATRVADLETAGFDAAYRGRTDDEHLLLVGLFVELARHVLGNALGDDGNGADLGVLQRLERRVVSRTQRSKVNHDVGRRVLAHGVGHALVHGDEDLAVAPVELLLVIPGERIYHGNHRRLFAPAYKVKVEHRLDGARLQAPHDSLRVRCEERSRRGAHSFAALLQRAPSIRLVRRLHFDRV